MRFKNIKFDETVALGRLAKSSNRLCIYYWILLLIPSLSKKIFKLVVINLCLLLYSNV